MKGGQWRERPPTLLKQGVNENCRPVPRSEASW